MLHAVSFLTLLMRTGTKKLYSNKPDLVCTIILYLFIINQISKSQLTLRCCSLYVNYLNVTLRHPGQCSTLRCDITCSLILQKYTVCIQQLYASCHILTTYMKCCSGLIISHPVITSSIDYQLGRKL